MITQRSKISQASQEDTGLSHSIATNTVFHILWQKGANYASIFKTLTDARRHDETREIHQ